MRKESEMKSMLIIVLLIISTNFADPSQSINMLINEKASIFDIGMLRLKLRLEQVTTAEVDASYSFKKTN